MTLSLNDRAQLDAEAVANVAAANVIYAVTLYLHSSNAISDPELERVMESALFSAYDKLVQDAEESREKADGAEWVMDLFDEMNGPHH